MKNNSHFNYAGDTGISGKRRNKLKRDNEFIDLYRKALDFMFEMKVPHPRLAAVNFTVYNGHPQYHVSLDRALIVVRKILHGNVNPVKPSLRAQMWDEISNKVKALMQEKGVSLPRATEFVLEHCRASRFFISPTQAYYHIHRKSSKV